MHPGQYLSLRPFDRCTVSRPCTWACSRIRNCLPGTLWMKTNSDLVQATWQDQVGENKLTMDGLIDGRGAARIAKKEHDKERRRRGKIHKKRLHILLTKIARPSKVGKPLLNRGPSQHVSDSSNGATLGRHSHLHAMEFIGNTM
jgi:hypothetical protein